MSENTTNKTEVLLGYKNEILRLRKKLKKLHQELPDNNLIAWTSGNVSLRIADTDFFIIKPSGLSYKDLKAKNMIICDSQGKTVQGFNIPNMKASSDAESHAYIYRNMPQIKSVVHTHSNYASAWAATGQKIPCALTAQADEFGGDIPIGPLAIIGDDSIGKAIVETLKSSRSKAILLQNHGVFTIGTDETSAVKSAVMVEDVAKTMYLAKQTGDIIMLDKEIIDKLYDRYQNVYGQ